MRAPSTALRAFWEGIKGGFGLTAQLCPSQSWVRWQSCLCHSTGTQRAPSDPASCAQLQQGRTSVVSLLSCPLQPSCADICPSTHTHHGAQQPLEKQEEKLGWEPCWLAGFYPEPGNLQPWTCLSTQTQHKHSPGWGGFPRHKAGAGCLFFLGSFEGRLVATSGCGNWDGRGKGDLAQKQDKLESLRTGSGELLSPSFSQFDIVM